MEHSHLLVHDVRWPRTNTAPKIQVQVGREAARPSATEEVFARAVGVIRAHNVEGVGKEEHEGLGEMSDKRVASEENAAERTQEVAGFLRREDVRVGAIRYCAGKVSARVRSEMWEKCRTFVREAEL